MPKSVTVELPENAAAPSLAGIEALARAAQADLPPAFRAGAADVLLRVADFPLDDMLDELDVEDPFELTGLYDGIPLPEKLASEPQQRPDMIWLFRRPILEEWVERGDVGLADLVTHIYVHELAHHFGWTDAQIAAIDRWWE